MTETATGNIPGWRRTILLFLTSQCITLFGSTLVQMALVWYAAMETASGAWVAAFTVCSYLPQFLVSFPGGVWADRFHRKMLIIGADAAIALATLGMVLAIPHISSEPALLGGLLIMSVVRSLGAGVQTPAVNAVIPQLVPGDQLMRYNGINAAMQSLVNFAAPTAAGAVFAVSTLRTTLMIDIVTALAGSGLLACLSLPAASQSLSQSSPTPLSESSAVPPGAAAHSGISALLSDMKTGINYALSDRVTGRLLLIYGLLTFFCVPGGYLAGLFVRRTFGETYWYLTAAELAGFAGMMAGGLLMSTWGGFRHREKTLAAGLISFGALSIALAAAKHFPAYLAVMAFYGIALTMVQTSVTTMLQEKTAPSMQGRIFGLMSTMYAGFLPLGMAVFGPLADLLPLPLLMALSGGFLILAGFFAQHSS